MCINDTIQIPFLGNQPKGVFDKPTGIPCSHCHVTFAARSVPTHLSPVLLRIFPMVKDLAVRADHHLGFSRTMLGIKMNKGIWPRFFAKLHRTIFVFVSTKSHGEFCSSSLSSESLQTISKNLVGSCFFRDSYMIHGFRSIVGVSGAAHP